MITLLSIIICLFVFLFTLYLLAREDFILFRKNVSIEEVYNIAFILLIVTFVSSRLFYVIFHFKKIYLNPLVFFHILHYPGLSLIGGVVGAIIFCLLFYRSKKIPLSRLADVFMLAFLFALPFTLLPTIITRNIQTLVIVDYALFVIYAGLAGVMLKLFLKWKTYEGKIALSVLLLFSLSSYINHVFYDKSRLLFIFSGEEMLLILLFISSGLLIIRQTFFKK